MLRIKPHLNKVYRKDFHIDKSLYKWRLDQSERVSGYDIKFFQNFLDTLRDTDFICYPYIKGLKEKIRKHHNLSTIDNVFLTPGSDVAIRTLFDLCVSPGDEVLSTNPCFPMYDVYSQLYQAKFVGIQYNKELQWNISELIDSITDKTSLIIIANPNNPIGDYKSLDELKKLFIYTREKGIPILIDEAYVQFIPESYSTCITAGLKFQNVVTCRTFSKALGGAGVRIGYMVTNTTFMEYIKKWRLMHEVTGPAVKFGSYVLDNYHIVEEYVKETNIEKSKLKSLLKHKYDIIDGYCNWLHINDKNDNEFICSVFDKYPEVIYKAETSIPYDLRTNWLRLTIAPGMCETKFIKELI